MKWKSTFIAILIAEGLAIAGFATSMPIIPFYLQELGAKTTAQVNFWNGLTMVGSAIALAIFSPIWGSLADYYGRKKMLLRATAGGVIVLGLLAFAQAPWQVFVLRVMQGMLTGTMAAATVLTSSVVPEKKVGFCLGLLQAGIFVGASIGPLFGGVISDFLGHRANFLATSGILALSSLIIFFFVHEDFTPKPSKAGFFKNAVPNFSIIANTPQLLPLFLIFFTIQLAISIVNPIMPLYIQFLTPDVKILGTATGLILSISAIASATAAAIIGKISDRFGYMRMLGICMAGAVVFYIPQGLAHNWIQLLFLRIFDGIFLGGTMPAVNALIAKDTPSQDRGSVFGISTSVSSAGMASGPAIGAVAAAFMGYRSVFFITAGLITISGVSLLFRNRKKHKAKAG